QIECRCIDPFKGQSERAEMNSYGCPRLQILMRQHRVARIHMHRTHKSAGLVGTNRKKRKYRRPKLPADVAEVIVVCSIAGKKYCSRRCLQNETTVCCFISIEQTSSRKMFCRNECRADFRTCILLLPPIHLRHSRDSF